MNSVSVWLSRLSDHQIQDAFRDLKKKIPLIADYEWGLNNSPETHNKGMTHGFILSFKSEGNRKPVREPGAAGYGDSETNRPGYYRYGKAGGKISEAKCIYVYADQCTIPQCLS